MALFSRFNQKGFTLTETLVVIAILALMLGAVVPALSGLSRSYREAAALRQLSGWMEEARSLALSEGGTACLAIADSTFDAERAYRAVALYHQPEGASALRQVTPWRVLPGHSLFLQEEKSLLGLPTDDQTLLFPVEQVDRQLPCFAFNSTGELLHPPLPEHATLVIGHRETAMPEAAILRRDQIVIARFTGRATFQEP